MAMGGANQINFATQTAATQGRGPVQGQQGPAGPVDGMAGSVPNYAPPIQPGQVQQAAAPQTYPSGLQLMKDQAGVAFQAVMPAGPFLPVQVAVMKGRDGQVQAKIFNPSQPDSPVALNAKEGSDGNIYIQVDSNNPTLLVLDPNKAEFGVTSPFMQQNGGIVREHAQMIGADGTRISTFNEFTAPDGTKKFTQIFDNKKGVWGANVTEAPGHGQANQGGFMRDVGRTFGIGGPNSRQEEPLTVKGNAAQGYDVKGGSLWGHTGAASRNGFNGFFDWRNAPVQKWLRGRQQEAIHLTPFSAAAPGALFPGVMNWLQSMPPAPAQAAPIPPGPPPGNNAAAAGGGPPNHPPGPGPADGPQPGPAPQNQAQLMTQLQEAINRGDMAAAQGIMAQLNGGPAPAQPQAPPPPPQQAAPPPPQQQAQQAAADPSVYNGVSAQQLAGALLGGDQQAPAFLADAEAKAQAGDPHAQAFVQLAHQTIQQVQQELLNTSRKLVAEASPEALGEARAALTKVSSGDQTEFQALVAAAQGGDTVANARVSLIQAVAMLDGVAAGEAAAQAQQANGQEGQQNSQEPQSSVREGQQNLQEPESSVREGQKSFQAPQPSVREGQQNLQEPKGP